MATRFEAADMGERDARLNSQLSANTLVDAFRKQLHLLSSSSTWSSPFMAFNVLRQFAIWKNRKFIDSIISNVLEKRFASIDQEAPLEKSHRRPLIDLAIKRYFQPSDVTLRDRKASTKRAARNAVLDQ